MFSLTFTSFTLVSHIDHLLNNPKMITTETPYKLADIIRDTWPQLYRPIKTNGHQQSKRDSLQGVQVPSRKH